MQDNRRGELAPPRPKASSLSQRLVNRVQVNSTLYSGILSKQKRVHSIKIFTNLRRRKIKLGFLATNVVLNPSIWQTSLIINSRSFVNHSPRLCLILPIGWFVLHCEKENYNAVLSRCYGPFGWTKTRVVDLQPPCVTWDLLSNSYSLPRTTYFQLCLYHSRSIFSGPWN